MSKPKPKEDGIHWERWLGGKRVESGFRDADDIDGFHTRDERVWHVSVPWDQWKKIFGTKGE